MNPATPLERAPGSGVDRQNPWPGLVAFTEELRALFHGRGEETDELLRRVERSNLTILFGQSGLGKSSLLQAGLFPRLRDAGYLPVSLRLDHSTSAPPLAEQVMAAVTRAIGEAVGRPEAVVEETSDTLWEHFHRRTLLLQTADGRPMRPVFVFDQFEELFAIGQVSEESRSRAARFLTELADLVENRAPETLERRLEDSPELVRRFDFDDRDYRMLICLREDYLPHLESLRRSMPSIAENRMRLTRMGGTRALEAVTNPAGEIIAPEVARQVVRFVAGAGQRSADNTGAPEEDDGLAALEVEPSLLSLVCRELNNRRLDLGLPQITADLLAGNRERILHDYYERCVADHPPAVRAFIEDELVTDSGLRENIALERALKALAQRGAPASAIDDLVKRRLLHLEERLDIQRVELTHDVLTAVVKKSRDERHQREATRRAEQQAQEVREKARRQWKRLSITIAGMAAALVVMSAFGVFSFYQWQEAVRQKEQARQAREQALKEKAKAEESQHLATQRFDEKREAMDKMLAQFSDKQLSGIPGTQPIRKVLFERGVEFYESMFRENQNDPTIQLSLADRYVELGRLQSEIGTLEQALVLLQKGQKVLQRLVEREPRNPDYRFRLGVVLYQIGYCCWEHKKAEPGIPALQESVRMLSSLAESEPANFEYALHLAQARTRLSALMTGLTKERDELDLVAYDALKQLVAERPEDPRALLGLARVTINRGFKAVDQRKDRDAEMLFEEGRRCLQRSIEVDPTDQIAYTNLRYSLMGLSQIYARTDRVAKGVELMTQVVADLGKLASANPAVFYYQQALVYACDDLRKLQGRSGDYEKAVGTLQEIVRISDGLAQRDPQNPGHLTDSINASVSIADILRNSKREAEAAAILDKTIKQAEPSMRLHPTSNDLLQQLLYAHQVRGELSSNVQQFETAQDAYRRGVDLFSRYRNSIKSLQEVTHYNYLLCCQGLLQIAKEKKETGEAIALAEQLIVPIKLETFTNGDYKQILLSDLLTLSQLYEDAGNLQQALRLRIQVLEESRRILGGDPKSNWYVYQQVFGAHRHLAGLYRKCKDERHEFESLRYFLKEEESYARERDHSALLAETASFTPQNLNRLREAFARFSEGGMKRFTVPTDFGGVKYPFHVYVTDSWQYLEDQITWVEKVRGGKVPPEVTDSFRRLYKIAKENKVSFMDLCVYALGTAEGDGKTDNENPIVLSAPKNELDVVLKQLAAAKQEIQGGKGGPSAKKRLALRYAKLAEEEIASSNYFRASNLLSESRGYIDLDSFDRIRDPKDSDVYAYIQYVQGALLACTGEPEKGFSRVMDSIQTGPGEVTPEFAVSAGNREFALGWISTKLHRPVEAAVWYRRAMELGHNFAAGRVYLVCQQHPECTRSLPADYRRLLGDAKAAATKDESAPAAFARLIKESEAKRNREATLAAENRRKEQLAQLHEMASQYHELAEVYDPTTRSDDYRRALTKEFETRGRQVELDPTYRTPKDLQGNIAVKIARSYLDSTQLDQAAEWAIKAARLDRAEALFELADRYEKGADAKADIPKANHYRHLGHRTRGRGYFNDGIYPLALPDWKKVCESGVADADDFDSLGMCYGKLNRWDKAIEAYTRSIEMGPKSERAADVICNLLEALICAERPDQVLQFVHTIDRKGWKPWQEGPDSNRYTALFHGFRAIALLTSGKDASDAERMMLQFATKPGLELSGWHWDELDGWLKVTKLAPDRKAAVEKVIAVLKEHLGSAKRSRYTDLSLRGRRSFREGRYEDALADLKNACDLSEASADDLDTLGQCYGKLGRWVEAIASYTRGIEHDPNSDRATGIVCDLLEALICTEQPEQLLDFVHAIEKKGWKLPAEGTSTAKYLAHYHGFRAMALIMSGKDASEAERMMRQILGKPGYKITGWGWNELDGWLKVTRLAPDRKAAVAKMIGELKAAQKR